MRQTIDQSELSKLLSLIINGDYKLMYDDLSNHSKITNAQKSVPVAIVNPILENAQHLTLADYIITFGQTLSLDGFILNSFLFTLQSEKQVEYIFPSRQKYPVFLKNRTFQGYQGFVRKKIVPFLYAIGFRNLLYNKLLVYSRKPLWFESLPQTLDCDGYLIDFTTGNQIVINLNQGKNVNFLVKIPIDNIAKHLSQNEFETLSYISNFNLKNVVIPRCGTIENEFLLFENTIPKKAFSPYYLENIHLDCLEEIYNKTKNTEQLEKIHFWKAIEERLILLDPQQQYKFWFDLYNSLIELKKTIDPGTKIPVSLAIGNFWQNKIAIKNKAVYIQSWEYAHKLAPLLFDAFHFIFYSETLGKKASFNVIKEELTRLKNQTLVKQFIRDEQLDFDLHLKLYILSQASLFMHKAINYPQQFETHNLLLLENWLKAAFMLLGGKKSISDRQVFLINFFSDPFSKTYVLLGFTQSSILKIAEWIDLDILVPRNNFANIIQFIKAQGSIRKMRVNKKFNKNIVEIFFFDGTYQRINFIFNFYTKGYNYLNSGLVFKNASRNHENIWIAHITDSFEYLSLPVLLKKRNLDNGLINFFSKLTKEQQQTIKNDLIEKYDLPIQALEDLYYYNDLIFEHLSDHFRKTGKKKFDLKFKTHYFFYSFRKKYPCNGLAISFSGPEGSGKSTVIHQFSKIIDQKYNRKYIILQQGPGVIPSLRQWKKRKSEEEILGYKPAKKLIKKQTGLRSFFRFLHYFADYLLGQAFVWLKYQSKGYVVIYDRYYFDFIADQDYCNIKLNKKIILYLFKLIHKPALNIFLYAPAEQLALRTEMNNNDFEKITLNYIELFHTFSASYKKSRYFSVENQNLPLSLEIIEKEFGKVV